MVAEGRGEDLGLGRRLVGGDKHRLGLAVQGVGATPRRGGYLRRGIVETGHCLLKLLLDGLGLFGKALAHRIRGAPDHRLKSADLVGDAVGGNRRLMRQAVTDPAELIRRAVGRAVERLDERRLELRGAFGDAVTTRDEGALDHRLDHRDLAGEPVRRRGEVATRGFLDGGRMRGDPGSEPLYVSDRRLKAASRALRPFGGTRYRP